MGLPEASVGEMMPRESTISLHSLGRSALRQARKRRGGSVGGCGLDCGQVG